MRCVLVLGGHPPERLTGNLLLDQLFGAELVWAGDQTREAVLAERAAAETAAGRRPYAIPIGGSTPLGAVGYALALEEVLAQAAARQLHFDRMVFASSSGGTHAGLVAGARLAGYGGQVLGISIDAEAEVLREKVARLANATLELLDPAARPGRSPAQAGREASSSGPPGTPRARVAPADIAVNAGYLGAGYGIMGPPERQAIRLFAETEGLLIDPVYTGRAAAGLIDLIRRSAFRRDETILFWHTGGTAALYAYADQLLA
jgi:1-aminocyclopropane-1-carboxylate deaminase/D-cysteine desulfhydrase-like pyridoxal-dependent ACC family enzyme